MGARLRIAGGVGALVVLSLAAGCSADPVGEAAPSSVLSAPAQVPSGPGSAERGQRHAVSQAYIRFWPLSQRADQRPEREWRAVLSEIATEPQLSTTLQAIRRQKAAGITTYGTVTVRISSVNITGKTATVVDCQDASQTGQADAATGDKKTVGVARMPVHATLLRDTNGQWKVSELEFPGGRC